MRFAAPMLALCVTTTACSVIDAASGDGEDDSCTFGFQCYGQEENYAAPGAHCYLLTGRFDNDETPDLAALTPDGQLTYAYNSSNPAGYDFDVTVSPSSLGNVTTALTADFDGDGLDDIVTANLFGHRVEVLSTQLGRFGADVFDADSLAVADVNEDGSTDLVVGSANGVDVLSGIDQFATRWTLGGGQQVTAVAVGNFVPDGHVDIIFATPPPDSEIILMPGDGTGSFTTWPGRSTCDWDCEKDEVVRRIIAVDFNGDTYTDLAMYVECTEGCDPEYNAIRYYANTGDGSFDQEANIVLSDEVWAVAVGSVGTDTSDPDSVIVHQGPNPEIVIISGDPLEIFGTYRGESWHSHRDLVVTDLNLDVFEDFALVDDDYFDIVLSIE